MRKNGNKNFLCILILACFTAFFCLCGFSEAKTAAIPINKRLSGKILLQVESKGEAWYVNTDNLKRYYLGLPSDAFYIMRELGLGISETDYWNFDLIGNKPPARLAGKILLRVEKKGEAYYVAPADLVMHYLGRPADAFLLMRKQGLGITNKDLEKIEVGKSIEAVIEARKNIPVKIDQQSISATEARIEREKAQIIEYKKNCAYTNGCEWYKGVMIKWVVDADTKEYEPSAESITDKDKIDRSIRVLKKGMDKYPEYFFTDENKGIRAIYVLSNMSVVATASTYDRKIYISSGFSNDTSFEQTFHHEYAHLLHGFNYDSFPEKEWDKINPPGFEYKREMEWGGGDVEINRNNGFIIGYSKASRNEDFADLVESLFKNPSNSEDNLWILKEKYKRNTSELDKRQI